MQSYSKGSVLGLRIATEIEDLWSSRYQLALNSLRLLFMAKKEIGMAKAIPRHEVTSRAVSKVVLAAKMRVEVTTICCQQKYL